MASPRMISPRHSSAATRRYHRSAFNGAKQLAAADAQNRRVVWLIALLVVALLGALAVVGAHLASSFQ